MPSNSYRASIHPLTLTQAGLANGDFTAYTDISARVA
jgi:hypothetical protein